MSDASCHPRPAGRPEDAGQLRRRRIPRGERAQGLVEFALVLPLFLILILATIDFGMGLRQYIVMTNSAREGARVGAVGETEAKITETVVDRSAGVLTTSDVTVTGALGASGTDVKVEVAKSYNFITPLGNLIALVTPGCSPSPCLPMTISATMRLE